MIEFKRKSSLANGNRINKTNWMQVVAEDSEKCTSILGVPEIEKAKQLHGAYYMKWHLRKEDKGYIFREQYSKSGINGHHPTYREAIFSACRPGIKVYLP